MGKDEKDLVLENGRVKGVTIVKPIVYGNMARYFGKKREEDGHTHQWTLYVKPYDNEDMSRYIKKIHFKLHDSYANPQRTVTCPPYEISETGWGEFEATIRIYFEDANEKPIVFYHVLKLFQNDPQIMAGKKPLVSEFYDEIVFQDPTLQMYKLLSNPIRLTNSSYNHDTDFEQKKRETLAAVQASRQVVRTEINDMKECLKEAKDLIQVFRKEIEKAGGSLNEES